MQPYFALLLCAVPLWWTLARMREYARIECYAAWLADGLAGCMRWLRQRRGWEWKAPPSAPLLPPLTTHRGAVSSRRAATRPDPSVPSRLAPPAPGRPSVVALGWAGVGSVCGRPSVCYRAAAGCLPARLPNLIASCECCGGKVWPYQTYQVVRPQVIYIHRDLDKYGCWYPAAT